MGRQSRGPRGRRMRHDREEAQGRMTKGGYNRKSGDGVQVPERARSCDAQSAPVKTNHASRPRREAAATRGPARVRLQQASPLAVQAIPRARRPSGRTCAAEAGIGTGARDNPRSRNARARRSTHIGPGQAPSGAAGVHAHARRPAGKTRAAKAGNSGFERIIIRARSGEPPTGATQVSRQDRQAGGGRCAAETGTGADSPKDAQGGLAVKRARRTRERTPTPGRGAGQRESSRASRVPQHYRS